MDALIAGQWAECLEIELGAAYDQARVEVFAVPLRPGSSRRRSRWVFLVATDGAERVVHEVLTDFHVEFVGRRGSLRSLVAWPRGRAVDGTEEGGFYAATS